MASAFKCDICGALYEDYKENCISIPGYGPCSVNMIALGHKFLDGNRKILKEFDLCKNCSDKIYRMVIDGQKEG